MAKAKYKLKTSFDAYEAINAGQNVIWENDKGTFKIVKDDPIYIMLANHVGSGSKIYGFWKEIEE